MQLYATGLNAWHQLEFQQTETEDEPLDYYAFKNILQGDKIERPLASLSQTLGTCIPIGNGYALSRSKVAYTELK
jgi:hypothetical protein